MFSMVKKIGVSVILGVGMLIGSTVVVSAAATIDKSLVAEGVLKINHDESGKVLKAIIDKEGVKYQYNIPANEDTYVPLQMGAGNYTVLIAESVGDNKYKQLAAETIAVGEVDLAKMYTYSVPHIYFNGEMLSMVELQALTADIEDTEAKVAAVYKYIVENFSYDFDKISSLPADYIPSVEEVYAAKKGICYDYSSLLAAALRNVGIPTKLQMGYAKGINEYHAWNEMLIGDTWCKIDATYDSQAHKAAVEVPMVKPQEDFQVVKEY